MRNRLSAAILCLLTVVLVAPSAGAQQSAGIAYDGPVTIPETGALFGTFVRPDDHTGADRREAMTNFEALVGRQMDVERVYVLWDDPWPTADDVWSRDLGRTLYMSLNASSRDGSGCKPWADIGAGLYDADLEARAQAVKDFGAPIIFSFHHEPTTKPEFGGSCGNGDEFKQAFRRVRDVFDAQGVDNATWAWTMTALSFQNDRGDEFYPGEAYVDLIAADGYNWYSCEFHQGPWREMDEIFRAFYEYGIDKGKYMFIAEYGSGEHDTDPTAKAQWFENGADLLKQWPEIKGVAYFNVGTGGRCDRYVDSSPESLEAFTAMGAEPYFNPPVATANVQAADFAFSPRTRTIDQGTGVKWTFNGPSSHTVTDASTMGLFDSGSITAGGTFTKFFNAAGNYTYKCSIHPSMEGMVRVRLVAEPLSGGVTTEFTITWSVQGAPDGWAHDIQYRRPGDTQWRPWLIGQTDRSATFVPDAGPGTYRFRARYVNSTNGGRSGYSQPITIVVS